MENTKKKNRGPGLSPKRQAIHEQWLKEQTTGDKLHAKNSEMFVKNAKPQAASNKL